MSTGDQLWKFVAVHGGAGYHVKASDKRVKDGLRRACVKGLESSATSGKLELQQASIRSTVDAIKTLEDDETFNAGYGSNLTSEGFVECDASLMTSSSHFGAVGAVPGLQNPIEAAAAIIERSRRSDPFGRVCPLLLVSEGAKSFARTQSQFQDTKPETLISDRAKAEWQYWQEIIKDPQAETILPPPSMQDTVGAVNISRSSDGETVTSAGVSSGGILMKLPGRVGEAAIYGAGCWASPRVAVSVSGNGEQIIRSNLAKALGQAVARCLEPGSDRDIHDSINQVMSDDFKEQWMTSRLTRVQLCWSKKEAKVSTRPCK